MNAHGADLEFVKLAKVKLILFDMFYFKQIR